MGMEIYLTQAKSGDCIIVRCGEKKKKVNLLIDSGQGADIFEKALKRVKNNKENIDMMIWTHDDNDHIKGACNLLKKIYSDEKQMDTLIYGKLLKNMTEERILFNFGGKGLSIPLGAEDVKELAEKMKGKLDFQKLDFVVSDGEEKEKIPYPNMIQLRWECTEECLESEVIRNPTIEDLNTKKEHLEIIILGPSRENLRKYIESVWEKQIPLMARNRYTEREWEKSIQYWMNNAVETEKDDRLENRVSIAFLIVYQGMYMLFAGDASPDDMVSEGKKFLKRIGKQQEYLDVAFIKLPHHGSSKNVNESFLKFFRTKNYLVSTGGNTKNQHPGKKTFAIIANLLEEEGEANIYSNYDWWKEKEEFCRAERREENWDESGDKCILIDREGRKKQLNFYKLQTSLQEINPQVFVAR